jgi:hypothetical protein
MPVIGVILRPGNTGDKVQELHSQLMAIGAEIAPGELTAKNFGESAAAVRAFQQRYGLPAGDALDPSTGRLLHAASPFAGPGGRVALRGCRPRGSVRWRAPASRTTSTGAPVELPALRGI